MFLSFVPSSPVWHGVVLLNYTKITGTVGETIDASSSPRDAFDVIALFVLLHVYPPSVFISKRGPPCQMNEDDNSNPGITVSRMS